MCTMNVTCVGDQKFFIRKKSVREMSRKALRLWPKFERFEEEIEANSKADSGREKEGR